MLAKAPPEGEAVIVADIDLSVVTAAPTPARHPEIYEPLAKPDTAVPREGVPVEVAVAAVLEGVDYLQHFKGFR